ncbi:MAG: stress response translation initiation inhibitor YciH [Candidatus Xenobia bacterium]
MADPKFCARCNSIPCSCKPAPVHKNAKIRLEKAGRHGKAVTVIFELGISEAERKELLKALKTECGTGGTAKEGTLEIQGDHRDRIEARLKALGYKVKRAGG